MKEQEIKETLSDIRDMMERSQKVMFLNGTSCIFVAVWALLGDIHSSEYIYGSIWPIWGSTAFPLRDITGYFPYIVFHLAATFIASCITVWIMSKHRAKRKGIEFKLDPGVKQLLRTFFTVMIVGGLFCLSCFGNGHWELIFGYMLAFYGLALVVIQEINNQIFRISADSSGTGCARVAAVRNDVLDHRILRPSSNMGNMVPFCF